MTKRKLMQDPVGIWMMVVLAVITILYMYAKSLLILSFTTLLLFILLYPMVKKLSEKVGRKWAVPMVLGGFLGLVICILSLIVRTVVPDLAAFAREFPEMVLRFDSTLILDNMPPEVVEYGNKLFHDAGQVAVTMVKESVVPILKTFSGVAEMIAVPVLVFYLLKDGEMLASSGASFLQESTVKRLGWFMKDVGRVLGGYIRGQSIIAAVSSGAAWGAMTLLGVPYAPILALVSALSEFVPVIGSVVATIPAVLVALSVSPIVAVKVLLFYIVMLKINHNFLYPKIVGQAIKVHPVFIMGAVLLFGSLFGVIGMLFAVPCMAVGRVWMLHLWDRQEEV